MGCDQTKLFSDYPLYINYKGVFFMQNDVQFFYDDFTGLDLKHDVFLRANIDQFTMVFTIPQSSDLDKSKKACEIFIKDLVNSRVFSGYTEYYSGGAMTAYNQVSTLEYTNGSVKIGFNSNNLQSGLCIMFSGDGLTDICNAKRLTTYQVYQELYSIGSVYGFIGHLSRCDIAIDEFNQKLTVDTLAKRLDDKRSIDRRVVIKDYRNFTNQSKIDSISNGGTFNTIYIGSQSESFLRIYNKQYEQLISTGEYSQLARSVGSWIRFEYVLRKNYARLFSQSLLNVKDNATFTALLINTVLNKYSFYYKDKRLPFTNLMIRSAVIDTGVMFSPRSRSKNKSLDQRVAYFTSSLSGMPQLVEDVALNGNDSDVVKLFNSILESGSSSLRVKLDS